MNISWRIISSPQTSNPIHDLHLSFPLLHLFNIQYQISNPQHIVTLNNIPHKHERETHLIPSLPSFPSFILIFLIFLISSPKSQIP